MKRLAKLALVSVLILSCWQIAGAQKTRAQKKADNQAEVKKMIDNSEFVFRANFALPQGGQNRTLTSTYDMRVKKDSIIAFLPYFGTSHMAPPPGSSSGGIEFTSTNFSYKKEQKRGGWEIIIKPKDHNISDWRDVQQMVLNVSPDGYASLQVISSNRDPISFQGEIVDKD